MAFLGASAGPPLPWTPNLLPRKSISIWYNRRTAASNIASCEAIEYRIAAQQQAISTLESLVPPIMSHETLSRLAITTAGDDAVSGLYEDDDEVEDADAQVYHSAVHDDDDGVVEEEFDANEYGSDEANETVEGMESFDQPTQQHVQYQDSFQNDSWQDDNQSQDGFADDDGMDLDDDQSDSD